MPNEFQSLRGQLLLDGGQLQGSSFHRAVVLICHHNDEGAFGLILNQKSPSTVAEVLDGDFPPGLKAENLFIGGPVQGSTLSYLHSDNFLLRANVLPNLHLGHTVEEVIELGDSMSTTQRLRIFAGYSGWGAGQLEGEMKRGAWLLEPATLDLIFEEEVETLWKKILLTQGWKERLLANSPDNPTSN